MAINITQGQYFFAGQGPLDPKFLVSDYSKLLSKDYWQQSNGSSAAYNGMLTAVNNNTADKTKNGLYFFFDPKSNARVPVDVTNPDNWHRLDGTGTGIEGIKIAIEQKDGVEYIVVKDKNDNEITSADASKFVQDSFLDDVVYDAESKKITFTWKMGDGSTKADEIDVANLVDTYTAGPGLKVENNEFSVDTSVIATAAALNEVKEIAEAAPTAQEISAAIVAKIEAENLSQYAKAADVEESLTSKVDKVTYEADKLLFANKADVEDALIKKLETGTITHASDTVAEGVTVNGTQLNIVVDAFTKKETRDYVADTIRQMTGGESASDVLLALTNYQASNDERVGAIETKNAIQDAAIEAKANASNVYTKGEADAKFMTESSVDSRINALINAADPEGGKVISDIHNLVKYVDENAGEVAALLSKVNTNTSKISEHDAAILAHSTALAGIIKPKASDEISIATDGALGIKEVNVNKLVQTEGDTLILNSGDANL